MNRRKTQSVKVGNISIGSNHPIVIQSMNNTKTANIKDTVSQLNKLSKAGCMLGRIALPDKEAVEAIPQIKKEINIPIVGDIHFDYKLAIAAVRNGIDKIRINPGNIGSEENIRRVIETCKEFNTPIRIGVNSGSLEKEYIKKYGGVTVQGMTESLLKNIEIFEKYDFKNLILSIKSSNVPFMIDCYQVISEKCDYPLHLGVTEAGGFARSSVKSSVGIGVLLNQGIGDTIRVSITGDVLQEIFVAKEILRSLNLINSGVNLISCPTCGRTQNDMTFVVDELEKELNLLNIQTPMNVAIMGCAVNGPGEAREADLGLAGGLNEFLLFKKGEVIRKVSQGKAVEELLKEIKKLAE